MAAYDHRFSVLVIDGHAINDWADGTDVLQINPSSDIGTLTEGINRSVFVSTKGLYLLTSLSISTWSFISLITLSFL